LLKAFYQKYEFSASSRNKSEYLFTVEGCRPVNAELQALEIE
tara:strand:+ start:1895 stop:2020 length:126 start_codon:yes stop_codon:yes gene_type:complete